MTSHSVNRSRYSGLRHDIKAAEHFLGQAPLGPVFIEAIAWLRVLAGKLETVHQEQAISLL